MVFSHAAGRAALVHVLKEVFDLDDDDPLSKSLKEQHLNDIHDLVMHSFEQVQNFTYKDDTGTSVPVPTYRLNLIRVLQDYLIHRIKETRLVITGPLSPRNSSISTA